MTTPTNAACINRIGQTADTATTTVPSPCEPGWEAKLSADEAVTAIDRALTAIKSLRDDQKLSPEARLQQVAPHEQAVLRILNGQSSLTNHGALEAAMKRLVNFQIAQGRDQIYVEPGTLKNWREAKINETTLPLVAEREHSLAFQRSQLKKASLEVINGLVKQEQAAREAGQTERADKLSKEIDEKVKSSPAEIEDTVQGLARNFDGRIQEAAETTAKNPGSYTKFSSNFLAEQLGRLLLTDASRTQATAVMNNWDAEEQLRHTLPYLNALLSPDEPASKRVTESLARENLTPATALLNRLYGLSPEQFGKLVHSTDLYNNRSDNVLLRSLRQAATVPPSGQSAPALKAEALVEVATSIFGKATIEQAKELARNTSAQALTAVSVNTKAVFDLLYSQAYGTPIDLNL